MGSPFGHMICLDMSSWPPNGIRYEFYLVECDLIRLKMVGYFHDVCATVALVGMCY